jgi:hypothetical protein
MDIISNTLIDLKLLVGYIMKQFFEEELKRYDGLKAKLASLSIVKVETAGFIFEKP